jgi:hypothetical protein
VDVGLPIQAIDENYMTALFEFGSANGRFGGNFPLRRSAHPLIAGFKQPMASIAITNGE